MKKAFQFLFFLGFGSSILALMFRSQDAAFREDCRLKGISDADCSLWDKLLSDFSTVSPLWIGAVMAAFTLSNLFRALRWQMLIEPLGHRAGLGTSFWSIILGYFANLGLPRMGEVVRAGALSRNEGVPMEKVMGTLVVDRLMDVVCLAFVVGIAFLLEGGTLWHFLEQQRGAAGTTGGAKNYWIWGVLGAGVLGLVFAYVFRNRLLALPIAQKALGILQGFWEGLRSVLRLRNPTLFVAYSIGIWLMFYLQCLFNLKAFGPTADLGASAALMVFVFGTLGFVIPSPGGMGTFHALCMAGLALYGVAGSDAFSYANIAFFSIQIFYNIVGGLVALVVLPFYRRRVLC